MSFTSVIVTVTVAVPGAPDGSFAVTVIVYLNSPSLSAGSLSAVVPLSSESNESTFVFNWPDLGSMEKRSFRLVTSVSPPPSPLFIVPAAAML